SDEPGLLDATVRFFVPARSTAVIRFSGIPHNPKPPIRIVAPSRNPFMATSALGTRLSIRRSPLSRLAGGRPPTNTINFETKQFTANCGESYKPRWPKRIRPRAHVAANLRECAPRPGRGGSADSRLSVLVR